MATIKQLQAKLDAMHLAVKTEVLEQIHHLMSRHGLTLADLDKSKAKRLAVQLNGSKPAKKSTAHKRGPQPPKYRNPKTGETWSGLARPPAWIKDVKNRDRFLIERP